MNDSELVEGLKNGDTRVVQYVVQQYAPALYRFAFYQLQDAQSAEDLVSEVMARMIRHIDTFVLEQASFQAWLFRIARNLAADFYRARKRRPQVSLEAMMLDSSGYEPGEKDARLDVIFDRDSLRVGLLSLTDEQRQVIVLHVIEGWELPQVAEMLGKSLPSVKSLYYRGVQSLRRAFIREDPEQTLG